MIRLSSSHPALHKTLTAFLTLMVLAACSVVTRPLENPAWEVVKAGQVETNLQDAEATLGQGLAVGMLGGFRTVLADFAWLQLYNIWMSKERAKLDAMIHLVTTLDPRPEFFWIGASRMLAYDVPAWRIKDEGGYFELPQLRQDEIAREQAEQAFTLLERAMAFHPESPELHLEIGQIYMNRLKDDAAAAEWFLKASQFPDAPYFAARVYAELLRRQGRVEDAYQFLQQRYHELKDAPFPQQDIVYERIQYYEALLEIPELLRFQR